MVEDRISSVGIIAEMDMGSAEFRGHEGVLKGQTFHGCEQYMFKTRKGLVFACQSSFLRAGDKATDTVQGAVSLVAFKSLNTKWAITEWNEALDLASTGWVGGGVAKTWLCALRADHLTSSRKSLWAQRAGGPAVGRGLLGLRTQTARLLAGANFGVLRVDALTVDDRQSGL